MRRIYKYRGLNYQVVILLMMIFACCSGKKKKVVSMNNVEESTVLQTKLDEKGIEIIDLGSNYKLSNEPFPMSEIVDASDVQYIKLETTDDALLPLIGRMKVVGSDIYISDVDNFKYVYRFNVDGRFICRIGQIGQGPGEYSKAVDFTADTNYIYLPIIDRDYVFVYDKDGAFVKKINKTMYTRGIEYKNGKLILSRGTVAAFDNIYSFILMDHDGVIQYKHIPIVETKLLNKNSWAFFYQSSPITQTKDHLLLFEVLDNYIYQLSDKEYKPVYKVDMGEYSMPMKFILDINSAGKDLYKYFTLYAMFETSKDILFHIYFGDEFSINMIVRFNKQSKKIEFWKQPEYQGEKQNDVLYNDIDGGPSYVIRNNLDDPNYLYTVIYPHMAEKYLEKWRNETVKYPEKRAQLCRLLSEMEDDDNPILVLYRKK